MVANANLYENLPIFYIVHSSIFRKGLFIFFLSIKEKAILTSNKVWATFEKNYENTMI